MAETKEEQLARLRQELGIEIKSEDEVDPDSGLTMADRARLTATGLLFNWADEAIAGVKALSPNITYEEALADEREKYVYLYQDSDNDDVFAKIGGGEFAFIPVKVDKTIKAYATQVDTMVEFAVFGLDSSAVTLS